MLSLLLVTIFIWALGNHVFRAFREHVPPWKRGLKLAVLLTIVAAFYGVAGSWAGYGLLGLVMARRP